MDVDSDWCEAYWVFDCDLLDATVTKDNETGKKRGAPTLAKVRRAVQLNIDRAKKLIPR